MKTYKNIVIILILTCSINLIAQQDSQYTQYMYNTMIVNPAYTGTSNSIRINSIFRNQWLGLEGAPKTYTLSVSSPLGNNIGLGFSAVTDQIGPYRKTNASVNFAYRLRLNHDDLRLSLGIKTGVGFFNLEYNDFVKRDPNDLYLQEFPTEASPYVGVGAYLYSDTWYIGLSMPNFVKSPYSSSETITVDGKSIHAYFIGGYVFDLGERIKLKPTTLLKYVRGSSLAIDVSLNAIILDFIWLTPSKLQL